MVTLQILVLSFLVRVRVSQQRDTFLKRVSFLFLHTPMPHPTPPQMKGMEIALAPPHERMDISKEG